jgi:acyl-coenzyme A thioesterase PaaI-like protein
MGAAVFAGGDDDERPVTIEMKVNYLEGGKPGTLRAVSRVRRRGSRFTVLEAEVLQDDRVLAFATGSFTTISR